MMNFRINIREKRLSLTSNRMQFQNWRLWLMILIVTVNFHLKAEAQKQSGLSDSVLYNGVRIPAVWPPVNMDSSSSEPMPVPYLSAIPKYIPINIGRQLFVDDFLIEKTDMKRQYHQAQKFEDNPVFSPETKEELVTRNQNSAVTYLGHGGVFYDPKDTVFKMFYTAGWRGGMALAISKDLIHWKRPSLGLAGDNIILPSGPLMAGGDNAVWLDLDAKDSMQRYKMITERLVDGAWTQVYKSRSESPTHTLHISADGRIWSQGVVTGRAADYCSFFYNPFRQVWIYSIKQNTKRGRARDYAESKDFLKGASWKNKVFWVGADKLDAPDEKVGDSAQLYSLNAVAYESIMLGEFYIHLGPANKVAEEGRFPKITELKLGFSRDGFHWQRPDRRPFINATRRKGNWDRAYIHGTNGVCLVLGDKIWFPYCAYSGEAPDGATGMYTGASIGMAYLRRDGFASMEAAKKQAALLTRTVTFNGSYLFVNVDCPEGSLKVEILDESNRVIPFFSIQNSVAVSVDKTLQAIIWKGGADLSRLRNKPVKFRFYLTNGKLYSFWVSPDVSGASYGYLGAGSPGNKGVIDNKGINGY
jgi:hypothetical protein